MSSTPSNNVSEKPEEETVEVIDVPENTYPSLQDGRKLLGIPTREFDKLYETCQSMIRDHQASKSTTTYRSLHNGDRPENHASFVLPIEKAYPVLRRCRDSWGVKWIIKKAKHAVAMKKSYANREKVARSRKEKGREKEKEKEKTKEKTDSQSSSRQGITLPSITPRGFLILSPNDPRLTGDRALLPGIRSYISRDIYTNPASGMDMYGMPAHLREPFPGPLKYDKLALERSIRAAADRRACDALSKESGAWLSSGPVRWDWQVKK